MEKSKHLTSLTTEQLIAQRKKTLGAFAGLGIVMFCAAVFLVYRAIVSNQPALIAVAIGCSISFLPLIVNLGMVNKEIKTRRENGENI